MLSFIERILRMTIDEEKTIFSVGPYVASGKYIRSPGFWLFKIKDRNGEVFSFIYRKYQNKSIVNWLKEYLKENSSPINRPTKNGFISYAQAQILLNFPIS